MSGSVCVLKNVRLVDSEKRLVENTDVLFSARTKTASSKILAVGQDVVLDQDQPVKLYSGGSRLFCRAFVDTASYICNRGTSRYGENYVSAAQAAQAGGFATVTLMPTPTCPFDTPAAVSALMRDTRTLDVQFLAVASIAVGERGKYRFPDYAELKKAGAVALSTVEKKRLPPEYMLEAMCRAKEADMTVYCPVSGNSFSDMGAVNEGRIAKLLGLSGIPKCGELLSVTESVLLAQQSGCRVHIPVISLAESVSYIRAAKEKGVPVTCGTAPQYFSLTEDDLIFRGVNAKLDPPLRTQADRAAIVEGLYDGTIDCITGDHRPCTKEEKGSKIATGAFGAAGLETAFAAGFTYLVLPGKLDLFTLIDKMSSAPAKILGIPTKPQVGPNIL